MHIKLRMELGNVSKRQQPDHKADNSRRPPMGMLLLALLALQTSILKGSSYKQSL